MPFGAAFPSYKQLQKSTILAYLYFRKLIITQINDKLDYNFILALLFSHYKTTYKMKKQIITTFVFILILISQAYSVKSQGLKYAISNIPEELKENADAVIREDMMEFEVISIGKTRMTHRFAVTIFSKKALHYRAVSLPYSSMKTLGEINGKTYNFLGMEVESLRKKDIKDAASFDGISIASDNREKNFVLGKHSSLPMTIYYEYSWVNNNSMFYPSWYAHSGLNTAVQHSSFKVTVPKGTPLHYKEDNLTASVQKSSSASKDHYYWEAKSLPALKSEPYGNIFQDAAPHVMLRPDKFEIEGYQGSFDTWKNMGVLMNKLRKGTDDLPPETVAKIKELIKNSPNKRDQVKLVYEYLQNNTRYVSIQLGIGGWQPFSASFVDKNSYGDCKALSNYMYSALKAIDIPSHYALVQAGEGRNIDKNFPASQFNHAFLCVPFEDDTVWLECTSQSAPFNYLGNFTDDRDVLLCTPEGGKIVHTKVYDKDDNLQIRKAQVVIDETGNAKAEIEERYTVLQQHNLYYLHFESKEEQKKSLYDHFDIPSFTIESFDMNWEKAEMPAFNINASVEIPNCASKSGKRLFIKPNLLSKWKYAPKQVDERKSQVVLKMAYTDTDSIVYDIPSKFHSEYLPKPVSIKNQFGSYNSSMELKDGKLIYTRKLVMNKGKFPKESYVEYVAFRKKIVKADRAKAVFVDKT